MTVAPPPEKLLDFVKDEPLVFAPGSKYEYSNSDNIVVGLVVQEATGDAYEEALQEQVYEPLGLSRTSLPAGPDLPVPFIHGYDLDGEGPPEDISEIVAAGWAWASGGIVSTPLELNRFIRGYVGGALFGPGVQAQQRQFVPGGGSEPRGTRYERGRPRAVSLSDPLRNRLRTHGQHGRVHPVHGRDFQRDPLGDGLDQPAAHAGQRRAGRRRLHGAAAGRAPRGLRGARWPVILQQQSDSR